MNSNSCVWCFACWLTFELFATERILASGECQTIIIRQKTWNARAKQSAKAQCGLVHGKTENKKRTHTCPKYLGSRHRRQHVQNLWNSVHRMAPLRSVAPFNFGHNCEVYLHYSCPGLPNDFHHHVLKWYSAEQPIVVGDCEICERRFCPQEHFDQFPICASRRVDEMNGRAIVTRWCGASTRQNWSTCLGTAFLLMKLSLGDCRCVWCWQLFVCSWSCPGACVCVCVCSVPGHRHLFAHTKRLTDK